MSTTSFKSTTLQTLKGAFDTQPKHKHRRDFLRENKLSLRDLQRTTAKKQEDREEKVQRQQKALGNRRSLSLTRPVSSRTQQSLGSKGDLCNKKVQTEDIKDEQFLYEALKKLPQSEASRFGGCGDIADRLSIKEPGALKQSDALSRRSGLQENYGGGAGDFHDGVSLRSTHTQRSMHSHASQMNGLDDDNAELVQLYSPRSIKSLGSNVSVMHKDANNGADDFDNVTMVGNDDDLMRQGGGIDLPEPQLSARSRHTVCSKQLMRSNGTNMYNQHGDHDCDNLNTGFDNLSLADNNNVMQHEANRAFDEPPLSARSRQTVCSKQSILSKQSLGSVASKRSTGSVHKLGSRDDVRLPRYLEREKREKEEKRQRELKRDVNCPAGHYLLSDAERMDALAQTKTKYQALVDELNRLPMTTQTLRVRNRRRDIENELISLEANIRIFSKSKVYVKDDMKDEVDADDK